MAASAPASPCRAASTIDGGIRSSTCLPFFTLTTHEIEIRYARRRTKSTRAIVPTCAMLPSDVRIDVIVAVPGAPIESAPYAQPEVTLSPPARG